MTTLNYSELGFTLDHRGKEDNVHMTHIRMECYMDVISDPKDDRVVTPESTNTPFDQQWVERSVVYGSQMALIAPMHYSVALVESISMACRAIDAVEKEELPGEESCPFFEGVASRLLARHAPAQELRALKDDFNYIFAYLPPWRTKFRVVRAGSNLPAVESAKCGLSRPAYLLRENSYLWDMRRLMAKTDRTFGGSSPSTLCNFDRWDDVIKTV